MRIGICTSLDNIEKVAQMGFDYIELSVSGIAKMGDEEISEAISRMEKLGIYSEAFNGLFPRDIRLTGQEVDEEKIKEYIDNAFAKVWKLGGKVVVFGSGGSRKIPEGWSRESAWKQLVEVARLVGDIAKKYDITIAMEPLNTDETNILNSVSEGYKFVQEVAHPNVKLLADFYHMRKENEDLSVLDEASSQLAHLHIANGNGRTYPLNLTEDLYEDFANILKKTGYSGRCSIEGKTDNADVDGPNALNLLREIL